MPTPTIPDGELFFNATTYTGNGGTQTITNGVPGQSFQPDFVWIKGRNAAWAHRLADAVRGVGKELFSNDTSAELTNNSGGYLTAFNSNGFSINSGAGVNTNNDTYVAWQWKANGAGSSNTAGSITSTVSANTTAGFSIVTYTGDRTSPGSSTVGHGLGVAPSLIITKRRDGTSDWVVQTPFVGQDYFLLLNTTAAIQTSASTGAGTLPLPTSTTFGVTYYTGMNVNGQTCVAYCWAPVAGYSAFGSYTGNGSSDGPFVYLGFRPKFVLIKRTDSTADWYLYDTSRSPYNYAYQWLRPDTSDAENTTSTSNNWEIDILSNGFKVRNNGAFDNASGGTYIYACFAENPFKYATAR